MKEYIEKVLHQDVQISPYKMEKKLPLAYRKSFRIMRMELSGVECLLAEPVIQTNLSVLRKQHRQLEIYTGSICVLCLKKMNYYTKDIMLEEGIPFIWQGRLIYLPFMGVLLDSAERKAPTYCHQISFLTQKLLITALYDSWKDVTVTKAAELLQVSKMSITRCYDELEALEIPYLRSKGRSRRLTGDINKKEMWDEIRHVLRSPVITEYLLMKKPDKRLPLGGISALAHYSMLSDNDYPTFSVAKKDLRALELTREKMMPAGESPACIIHEIGYRIDYEKQNAIDPLSVALSINDRDMNDPRVSLAVEEMLEKYVW